jgi:hypothetical protein
VPITDSQGYTFTLDFNVGFAGPSIVNIADEKPGYSTVTRVVQVKSVGVKNTTPGRVLPMALNHELSDPPLSAFIFGAIYVNPGPVCKAAWQLYGGTTASYCVLTLAHSQVVPNEIGIGASMTLTSNTSNNHGAYFAVDHVPDASLAAVQSDLDSPVGYAVIYFDQSSPLSFTAYDCGSVRGVAVFYTTSINLCAGTWALTPSP